MSRMTTYSAVSIHAIDDDTTGKWLGAGLLITPQFVLTHAALFPGLPLTPHGVTSSPVRVLIAAGAGRPAEEIDTLTISRGGGTPGIDQLAGLELSRAVTAAGGDLPSQEMGDLPSEATAGGGDGPQAPGLGSLHTLLGEHAPHHPEMAGSLPCKWFGRHCPPKNRHTVEIPDPETEPASTFPDV